jgi:uncharacterized membrane protein
MISLPGAAHLQNIHPLFVHYPIAFWGGAALLYAAAWGFRKENLATAGFALLVMGTIGGIVSAGTGLYAQGGVMIARSVRAELLEMHEHLMLTALGIGVVATVWALLARPFPLKGRILFMLLLAGLSVVLSLGADYGGRMVYDYNAGGNACPQPIEFTK